MPTFHLVVDEAVPVSVMQCRVRVWRQAGLPALVLSSQLPGQPPPDCYSSLLANIVLRSFLEYSLPIPFFFELSTQNGKPRGGPSPLRRPRRATPPGLPQSKVDALSFRGLRAVF
jgi:hypothetical protein